MKIDTVLEYTLVRFLAIWTFQIHPVIKISPHFQNGRHYFYIATAVVMLYHRISNIDLLDLTIFLTKLNSEFTLWLHYCYIS